MQRLARMAAPQQSALDCLAARAQLPLGSNRVQQMPCVGHADMSCWTHRSVLRRRHSIGVDHEASRQERGHGASTGAVGEFPGGRRLPQPRGCHQSVQEDRCSGCGDPHPHCTAVFLNEASLLHPLRSFSERCRVPEPRPQVCVAGQVLHQTTSARCGSAGRSRWRRSGGGPTPAPPTRSTVSRWRLSRRSAKAAGSAT